jgi:hypothetical protein
VLMYSLGLTLANQVLLASFDKAGVPEIPVITLINAYLRLSSGEARINLIKMVEQLDVDHNYFISDHGITSFESCISYY